MTTRAPASNERAECDENAYKMKIVWSSQVCVPNRRRKKKTRRRFILISNVLKIKNDELQLCQPNVVCGLVNVSQTNFAFFHFPKLNLSFEFLYL